MKIKIYEILHLVDNNILTYFVGFLYFDKFREQNLTELIITLSFY